MQPVVLVAVAAVWAAVIIPPLLRSRVENRPNSSVTDFRRQLSTLQRTVPTRTMVPMRGMARPLTQAPQARAHGGHPGQVRRATGPVSRQDPSRQDMSRQDVSRQDMSRDDMYGASLERRHATEHGHRTMHVHRVSKREMVRRRRANVLYVLAITVGITGFLAATTHSNGMVYIFALAFVSLCGYCYKLVQIRAMEHENTYSDQSWFHAA
jgi:hypothetical protein